MDPERREEYDKHKVTADSPNFKRTPDYSSLRRFELEDDDYSGEYDQDRTNKPNKTLRLNHMDVLYKQTISYK